MIGKGLVVDVERSLKRLFVQMAMVILLVPALIGWLLSPSCAQLKGDDTGSGASSTEKIWFELQQRKPYPHKAPLPPPVTTAVDGTYVKLDPTKEGHVPCRRCPDYAPEGGIWKLQLDRGIFRIFHQVTRWRSIGSFVVNGSKLSLFNDPYCHELVGTYNWKVEERRLILEVIEDECAIHLRAKNLTGQPWLSCRPPTKEAAISGHWEEPPGCSER